MRRRGSSLKRYFDALAASSEIVSLPMFAELTEEQISYVVGRINEFRL